MFIVFLILLFAFYFIWRSQHIILLGLRQFGYFDKSYRKSPWFLYASIFFFVISLLLLYYAFYCSEQFESEWSSTVTNKQLYVILDCSASMDAESFTGKSRLENAKDIVRNLPEQIPDWELALVTFSGEAFLDFPASIDHASWLAALEACDTDSWQKRGSAPAEALLLAEMEIAANSDSVALILLLSDGEVNVLEPEKEAALWRNRKNPCIFIQPEIAGAKEKVPAYSLSVEQRTSDEEFYTVADKAEIIKQLSKSDSPWLYISGLHCLQNKTILKARLNMSLMRSYKLSSDSFNLKIARKLQGILLLAFLCIVISLIFSQLPLLRKKIKVLLIPLLLFSQVSKAGEKSAIELCNKAASICLEELDEEKLLQLRKLYIKALQTQPGYELAAENLEMVLIMLQKYNEEGSMSSEKQEDAETKSKENEHSKQVSSKNAKEMKELQKNENIKLETIEAAKTWKELDKRRKKPVVKQKIPNAW